MSSHAPMQPADVARLVALAAIWSLSFVFVRVLVPALGPAWTTTLRLVVAGVALVAWLAVAGTKADLRAHGRAYLFVGLVNCAAPFLLFAWAALTLPASYLVVLNTAAPMLAAIGAALVFGERLTAVKAAGLVAGAAGVALVSGAGPIAPSPAVAAAVVASLAACACYAWAGLWLKARGQGLAPVAVAAWSQMLAGLVMLPAAAATTVPGPVDAAVVANVLALALVCSGLAYLLYYRLIRDVGPTRAMTVTFLMPPLGLAWGTLFLGERVTSPMLAGVVLVVVGTAAILRSAPVAPARA
jgi:drug/metabolite transporter (DMT)-like permease